MKNMIFSKTNLNTCNSKSGNHTTDSLLKVWVKEFEKFVVWYRNFVYLSKCSLVKPHLQKAYGLSDLQVI
jgi:hypothetical protein